MLHLGWCNIRGASSHHVPLNLDDNVSSVTQQIRIGWYDGDARRRRNVTFGIRRLHPSYDPYYDRWAHHVNCLHAYALSADAAETLVRWHSMANPGDEDVSWLANMGRLDDHIMYPPLFYQDWQRFTPIGSGGLALGPIISTRLPSSNSTR